MAHWGLIKVVILKGEWRALRRMKKALKRKGNSHETRSQTYSGTKFGAHKPHGSREHHDRRVGVSRVVKIFRDFGSTRKTSPPPKRIRGLKIRTRSLGTLGGERAIMMNIKSGARYKLRDDVRNINESG